MYRFSTDENFDQIIFVLRLLGLSTLFQPQVHELKLMQKFEIRRRSTLKSLKQSALQNIQKLDMHLDEQTQRDLEIRKDLKVRIFSPFLHMF